MGYPGEYEDTSRKEFRRLGVTQLQALQAEIQRRSDTLRIVSAQNAGEQCVGAVGMLIPGELPTY